MSTEMERPGERESVIKERQNAIRLHIRSIIRKLLDRRHQARLLTCHLAYQGVDWVEVLHS